MTTLSTATAPYPRADIAAAVARALRRANDYPDPDADADRSSGKYSGMSQDFVNGAWRHLDEGDLSQASNKAWGLVAETVKAISAEHGGIIHKHRSIMEVVTQLAQLVEDAGDANTARQITSSFGTARDLHTNFYENELSEYIVLKNLMECEALSALLFALFWPAGAQPAPAAAEHC